MPSLLWIVAPGARALPPAPIIHGESAEVEDWPMTGGVIVSGRTRTEGSSETLSAKLLLCSSTLIAPDVVLLAGHCVDLAGMWSVLDPLEIGWSRQTDLSTYGIVGWLFAVDLDWPADTVLAREWRVHPDFVLEDVQTGLADNHDIALLFLEEPVLDVPFALLPTREEAAQVVPGRPVVVVGWGQQEVLPSEWTIGVKQQGVSSIAEVSTWEFHVGPLADDVRKCHGDSGGPSFLLLPTLSADPVRLVGVTSHTWDPLTDCLLTGGVDTRVDHHLGWIDATMREGCADGTRSWCEAPGVVRPPDAYGRFAWEVSEGSGCATGSARAVGWLGVALAASRLRVKRRPCQAPTRWLPADVSRCSSRCAPLRPEPSR